MRAAGRRCLGNHVLDKRYGQNEVGIVLRDGSDAISGGQRLPDSVPVRLGASIDGSRINANVVPQHRRTAKIPLSREGGYRGCMLNF